MPIDLKGKKYYQVAERLVKFHEDFPDYRIQSEVINQTDRSVTVEVRVVEPMHSEEMCVTSYIVHSTGHAEGYYNGGEKVLEKTESVACGRALAFLHPDLMGTDIASADEIAEWMRHGQTKKLSELHAKQIADLLDAVDVDSGEGVLAFGEAWTELDEPEQRSFGPWVSTFWPGGVSKAKEKMRATMWAYRQEMKDDV